MIGWFAPSGRPMHVLLTKSDKLSRGAAAATLQEVRRALEPLGPQVTVQLFSSLKKSGVEEVERVIGGWLVPAGYLGEAQAAGSRRSTPAHGRGRCDAGSAKQKPPTRGRSRGRKCLTRREAPAQGGEAGDGRPGGTAPSAC
jgi:GTP-binding protein